MTLAEVARGDSVPLFSPDLGWAPRGAPSGFLQLAQPNRFFDNEVPRPPFLCVLMGPRGLQLSLCLPGPIPTGISIMECRGRHFCARLWDPRGFPGYIAFPTQPAHLGRGKGPAMLYGGQAWPMAWPVHLRPPNHVRRAMAVEPDYEQRQPRGPISTHRNGGLGSLREVPREPVGL